MRNMKAMQVSFREKADKELDAEALRVVGLMPKWIPAKEKGKTRSQNLLVHFDKMQMKRGKKICDTLKEVRMQVAKAWADHR